MPYRHKLRFRIFLSYPLLGLLISLITMVLLILSYETLEQQFLDTYLNEELDNFISFAKANPEFQYQQSTNWTVYKVTGKAIPRRLVFLAKYPEGTHEIEYAEKFYHLGVKKKGNVQYYMLYDDTALENLERNIILYLVAGSFVIIWLTTWYGLSLSKKVMEPISSLAARIKTLDMINSNRYISEDFADDEVGALALEFDAYRERLQGLIRREREFTSNASHELRTPLAVITVTSESLSLQPSLPENLKEKVCRIRRAADEMTACLDALLALARERNSNHHASEKTAILQVVEQIADDHRDLLNPNVKVLYEINARPSVNAPYAMVAMLIRNLLKNAFVNTLSGSITFNLNDQCLTVTDTGRGITTTDMERIFERGYRGAGSRGCGFGLEISKRICENYGWQLQFSSKIHNGTCVRWRFTAA